MKKKKKKKTVQYIYMKKCPKECPAYKALKTMPGVFSMNEVS